MRVVGVGEGLGSGGGGVQAGWNTQTEFVSGGNDRQAEG